LDDLQKLPEDIFGSHEKKPPVFIGLGAVFQQDFGTLFGNRNPLAFLRIRFHTAKFR
jgi:hypothetical protein